MTRLIRLTIRVAAEPRGRLLSHGFWGAPLFFAEDTSGPPSPRCVRSAVSSPELRPSSSSLIEFTKAKSLPVSSLRRDVVNAATSPNLNLCSPHRVFVRQAMSASLILFARKRTNHLVHVELLGFLRPSQSFSDAAKRTTSREVFPPGCVDTWSSPD